MLSNPKSRLTFAVGCVHGRFQPFHLGHLEYVWKAYEVSELLYIGLANSDPGHTDADAAAPHRHLADANPFPYFARMEMIIGALKQAGAELDRLRVIPFPINRLELLPYYVPREAVHLITIYDEWGKKKVRALEEKGLSVEVLWTRTEKFTTGTIVRELLVAGAQVSHLVPKSVDDYLRGTAGKFPLRP